MPHHRQIKKIAVIGAGTMGAGIAALCAQADIPVVLLDITKESADKAVERMLLGRFPAIEESQKAELITTAELQEGLPLLKTCDWICEAVVEDLAIKRDTFKIIEAHRKEGSIVSTNTSGIPLRDIDRGLPERLRQDILVTHFFNPVKQMRLVELIPGSKTKPEVIEAMGEFCGQLGKGAVYAKDTVNFIGNRIGCFWILSGLHLGREAREQGLDTEFIDAIASLPAGIPATGLYGLVDLIGLDIMDKVSQNLAINLPDDDIGRAYTTFPPEEISMVANGQLGRKSGGGYYRVTKSEDGSKTKEVFDLLSGEWRTAKEISLDPEDQSLSSLINSATPQGHFFWLLMSTTLSYAADLIPEIADDIVNIDRALRWGFGWERGPFEILDAIGATEFSNHLLAEKRPLPKMIQVLNEAGAFSFYRADGSEFLGVDGLFHPVPES